MKAAHRLAFLAATLVAVPHAGAQQAQSSKSDAKPAAAAKEAQGSTKEDSSGQKPAAKEEKPKISTYPDPADVVAAMKKAASYFRNRLAYAGGYAWTWPKDRSTARTEGRESPSAVTVQPPGTPSVGLAMLEAYKATGDALFLQGAREAAQSLIWSQLSSGGWDSEFDYDPNFARRYHFRRDLEAGDMNPGNRHADSTLDDNKTQSALLFLLELAHTPACEHDAELKKALKFGFDGLLAAQAPNGGWGQHFEGDEHKDAPIVKASMPAEWPHQFPAVDYTRNYTLNDGNIRQVIDLLLRAYEVEKDERYLAAATKAGEFLLLAQFPEPQPIWAQQYNHDMQPVWARKFEPPAVSSVESITSLQGLVDIWLATGDSKWLAPHKAAFEWFERSKLADGKWARFYELGTNKPLYCKAGTYEITYDDSDLPTHYGFKVDTPRKDIEKMKAAMVRGREAVLRDQLDPTEPKKWASRAKGLAPRAVSALEAQSKDGYWSEENRIDAGAFVKHMRGMSSYVNAAQKGGEAFTAIRAAAAEKEKQQSGVSPESPATAK